MTEQPEQKDIVNLVKRLDDLASFLKTNICPLETLTQKAKKFVEVSEKHGQMLRNPNYWNDSGNIRPQYSYQLNKLHREKEEALGVDYKKFLWEYEIILETVKQLEEGGIITNISIGEYLHFLGLYLNTINSNFGLYMAEDLNCPLKSEAIFKFVDYKSKILDLIGGAKKSINEIAPICRSPFMKKVLGKRTPKGELRKSLERLLDPNSSDEGLAEQKPETISPEEKRSISIAQIATDRYYELEIRPSVK